MLICVCVCVLCVNAAATMASARVSADFRTREAHALGSRRPAAPRPASAHAIHLEDLKMYKHLDGV